MLTYASLVDEGAHTTLTSSHRYFLGDAWSNGLVRILSYCYWYMRREVSHLHVNPNNLILYMYVLYLVGKWVLYM